jgi:DNA-binding NarL/FixJ family response regulator
VDLGIVVADDNDLFRIAVLDAFAGAPGLDVVADVRSGGEALAAAAAHQPDLLLMDVGMPGGGPGLAEEMSRRHPDVRLICLSAQDDPGTVLRMLSAGATGYIAKGDLDDDLACWVRRCVAGELVVVADCAHEVARSWPAVVGRGGRAS